jgi:NitT/TauT family transport system substrate-binding protein
MDALNEKLELPGRFVQANRDLTDWISKNPAEAQKIVKAELLAETRSYMSAELIAHGWERIIFTNDMPRASVQAFVANSQKAGFMKTAPDISRLFEVP